MCRLQARPSLRLRARRKSQAVRKKEKKPEATEEKPVEEVDAAAEAPVKAEKRSAKRKRLAAEAEAGIISEEQASSSSKKQAVEEKPKRKAASKSKSAPAVDAAPATKTTFGDDGEVASEQAVKTDTPAPAAAAESAKGNKFILFVGNMAFTTTVDYITKHFGQACGEVPSVRLLTRKADPNALANLPASKRKSIAKG